jgi:hypothetical protein
VRDSHPQTSAALVAGLELAKHGDVVLRQREDFAPIYAAPA